MWFWIIYVVGLILWYLYVRAYYSEDGLSKKESTKISNAEMFILFCPIMNIILSIIGWIAFYPYLPSNKSTERKERKLKKFFNIKD